jgi:hypothetical protein
MIMIPFSNRNTGDTRKNVNDRLAAAIAGKIIDLQTILALRLNRWFNSFSTARKKWMLVSIGALISGVLISGICTSTLTMPLTEQDTYTAGHIGRPSGQSQTQTQKKQLTDSLTIKK